MQFVSNCRFAGVAERVNLLVCSAFLACAESTSQIAVRNLASVSGRGSAQDTSICFGCFFSVFGICNAVKHWCYSAEAVSALPTQDLMLYLHSRNLAQECASPAARTMTYIKCKCMGLGSKSVRRSHLDIESAILVLSLDL